MGSDFQSTLYDGRTFAESKSTLLSTSFQRLLYVYSALTTLEDRDGFFPYHFNPNLEANSIDSER